MPWFVMKFDESEEVEALPQNWYDYKNNIVYYPPYPRQQLQRAIKNQLSPDMDTWTTYKVTLMRSKPYETFIEACSKASRACITSDLSAAEEVLPTKRIVKKKLFSDSDSESESEESLINVPAYPRREDLKQASGINKSRLKEIQEVSGNKVTEIQSLSNKENIVDDDMKFRQIMTVIIKQKKIISENEQKLDKILDFLEEIKILLTQTVQEKTTQENVTDDVVDIFEYLPISSFENLEKVENLLGEKNVRNKFITTMRRLGGSNFKECSRRFMRKILHDDIAKFYSLHGHKGKKKFSSTKMFLALLDTILICDQHTTKKDIELVIGQWLAKATERLKKKNEEEPSEPGLPE